MFIYLQVVLYKVGCLVGGAGLIHLLAFTSWTTTFTLLSILYILTAVWATSLPTNHKCSRNDSLQLHQDDCATLLTEEKSQLKAPLSVNERNVEMQSRQNSQVLEVLSIMKEVVHSPGTFWISVYVLLYKMGERGAINNMPLYLLDKGMSKQQLAFWNGTICQGLSILGSFYGGIILAKENANIKSILIKHSSYRFFSVILQWLVILFLEEGYVQSENTYVMCWMGIASICSLSYSSGVISTATFTLMMHASRQCSDATQATHYSVLASIEVAGKLLFATLAGFLIDYMGMVWTFILFAFLCTLPAIILFVMPDQLSHIKRE